MRKDRVLEVIVNKGFDARIQDTYKNGVKKTGVVITSKGINIAPVIYIDGLDYMTDEEIADYVIDTFNKYVPTESLDMCWVQDFDKVKDKLAFYIQGKAEQGKIFRGFLDLFLGVKINLNVYGSDASIKVTDELLEAWKISEDELFDSVARDSYTVQSMFEALQGLSAELIDEVNFDVDMYVISNQAKSYGATCLYYTDIFENIARQIGDDLYIIPSSIHECIVVPVGLMEEEQLAMMIQEINATEVDITEQLSNHPYRYSFADNTIR